MLLTITIDKNDDIFPLDVSGEMSLADFKALLEAESAIAPAHQQLLVDLREVRGEDLSLEELGLKENDMVVVRDLSAGAGAGAGAGAAAGPTPETAALQIEAFRRQVLSNPDLYAQLTAKTPELIGVLSDAALFKQVFQQHMSAQQQTGGLTQAEMMAIEQNPDDPENQQRIMELINQQAIDENRNTAYENSPEAFASVSMLYIDVEVNGHMVKAFVDTGAQITIISPLMASACGLERLIDKRYHGEARGVGTGKILGRVHSAPIRIAGQYLPCSFTVLDASMGIILGLDMMRRHQIIVNLKRNVLTIDEEHGIETPFLGEADIPKEAASALVTGAAGNPSMLEKEGKTGGAGLAGSSASEARVAASDAASKRAKVESAPISQTASSLASFASQTIAPSAAAAPFPDTVVKQLCDLGFSRLEVARALEAVGGNADAAASLLFSL